MKQKVIMRKIRKTENARQAENKRYRWLFRSMQDSNSLPVDYSVYGQDNLDELVDSHSR